eukprot:5490831-Amphidinium_carterae.1
MACAVGDERCRLAKCTDSRLGRDSARLPLRAKDAASMLHLQCSWGISREMRQCVPHHPLPCCWQQLRTSRLLTFIGFGGFIACGAGKQAAERISRGTPLVPGQYR